MKKLSGKVAIVTGASKGIGAAIAKEYAANGASVVVNYSSSKEDAERVVKEIIAQDGKAVAVQANVASSTDVKRLFEEAKKAFGHLDILVNNAGIYKFGTLEEITEEEWRAGKYSKSIKRNEHLAIDEDEKHFYLEVTKSENE